MERFKKWLRGSDNSDILSIIGRVAIVALCTWVVMALLTAFWAGLRVLCEIAKWIFILAAIAWVIDYVYGYIKGKTHGFHTDPTSVAKRGNTGTASVRTGGTVTSSEEEYYRDIAFKCLIGAFICALIAIILIIVSIITPLGGFFKFVRGVAIVVGIILLVAVLALRAYCRNNLAESDIPQVDQSILERDPAEYLDEVFRNL